MEVSLTEPLAFCSICQEVLLAPPSEYICASFPLAFAFITAGAAGPLLSLLLPLPLLRLFLAEQPEDFPEQNQMSSLVYSEPSRGFSWM